jgi:ectoine hydroxylase
MQILASSVYVHQSRINYKPAFRGREFYWHSDFETWHVEDGMPRMRAVSVSLSLTENTEFNGPLMVVPQSHQWYVRCVGATPADHFKASLRKQLYGVPNREALEMLVSRGGIQAPKGPPGSATFFESNLMHGSTGNLSPAPRINLFVVYNSVENAVTDPFGSQPPRPEFLAERRVVPIDDL